MTRSSSPRSHSPPHREPEPDELPMPVEPDEGPTPDPSPEEWRRPMAQSDH